MKPYYSRRAFLAATAVLPLGNAFATSAEEESLRRFSVVDYGAVGDGQTLNTRALQKAVDAATGLGGGIVHVPAGRFITGTVLLKDNVTLQLEKNAQILGSYELEDYINIDPFTDAVGDKRGRCLIGARGASNIAITGDGEINGRGERMVYTDEKEWKKRPFLIRIVNCKGVSLDGITTRNSAAWNVHIYQSDHVRITNLRILSQSEGNGDGIDIDSSQHVYIAHCDINAHDDSICFKATSPRSCGNAKVEHCRMASRWGALKFGTESMGNFENIEVSDCYIYDTLGGGVKILSVDGSNISNIHIHDIEMNDVEMPIFIRLGARLNTYRDAKRLDVGSIDGVRIENILVHGKRWGGWKIDPPGTIFITGLADARIRNVHIENIDAVMYYQGTAEHAAKVVPEKREHYPEFIFFDGHLPAYGAYIRHARDVSLKNIQIRSVNEEQRHIIKAIDVQGLQVDDLRTEIDKGAVTPFSFENSTGVSLSNLQLSGAVPEQLVSADDLSEARILP